MKKTTLIIIASLVLIVFACKGFAQAEVQSNIQAKDFSRLIGMKGFSDTLLNNHFKLYQGYMKNTNMLLEKLNALAADKKGNTPEYAELKRRLGWEFNGALLHEYYFENLGESGSPDEKSALYKSIVENFGSLNAWKRDFISTASMRGIGWVVLYYEPRTGKLVNTWINEHDVGHITAAKPIIVIDVFEHAYMPDYDLDRAKYIENFLTNLNWNVAEGRFDKISQDSLGVSAAEDLMREHGVLRRIVLIYDKILHDLEAGKNVQYDALNKSANIIHDFIENYHEKLEENYIFPMLEKKNVLADLIKVLRQQHEAGRKLTQSILALSKERRSGSKDRPNALADDLNLFMRMYRVHAAREDTVLFPALHDFISQDEYEELGEEFEDKEHELFGEDGYKKIATQVEDIEKELGIYEISQFTPVNK